MRQITSLIFLILIYFPSLSQHTQLTVKDLHFNSTFEQKIFQQYPSNSESYLFYFFLATTPLLTSEIAKNYHTEYRAFLEEFLSNKFLKKSPRKQVKILYQDAHEKFLKAYENQNHFGKIFSKGYYNCVSSTALYGLILNDLDIPFSIREKPTHVYLIIYPESDRIIVETTNPQGHLLTLDDRYKLALIEQLRSVGLISIEDYESKSIDELFNQFYALDKDIGLKELVGIQYLNDAVYKLQQNDKVSAFHQFEKAYFFYPQQKTGAMMAVTANQILDDNNYSDLSSMEYLAKLSRMDDFGMSDKYILSEFNSMTQHLLINKNDTARYKQFYEKFTSASHDEQLNNEISYIYNVKRGAVSYSLNDYDQALQFLEKAYLLKPENVEVTSMYINAMTQKLDYESDNSAVVRFLESKAKNNPKVKTNLAFNSLLLNAYIVEFGQAFDLNDEKQGLHYKKLFEESYSDNLNLHATNIGRAYSMAAVFYFKKGHTSKAKKLLETGLKYAPGNYELLRRLRMIK